MLSNYHKTAGNRWFVWKQNGNRKGLFIQLNKQLNWIFLSFYSEKNTTILYQALKTNAINFIKQSEIQAWFKIVVKAVDGFPKFPENRRLNKFWSETFRMRGTEHLLRNSATTKALAE